MNSKECIVDCGAICIRNINNDSRRLKEVRSHGNVYLEKDKINWVDKISDEVLQRVNETRDVSFF